MKHFFHQPYYFFDRSLFLMCLFISVFVLSFLAANYSFATNYNFAESLVIKNVHVIGSNAKVSQLKNVLIVDGHIRAISSRHMEAQHQLDGEKGFLIPGLIDTHVHLQDIPGFVSAGAEGESTAKIAAEAFNQIPRSYLYFGFTTLLDLAGDAALRESWQKFDLAPEVFYCAALPIPNGYPLAWLPEEQRHHAPLAINVLWDERQPAALPPEFTKETHNPAVLIKAVKSEGASCIKMFYEHGFGPLKNLPVPSEELMKNVVAAAHKENLNVFLHGNSSESHIFGMKTGVDVMAHGIWHAEENFEQQIPSLAKAIKKSRMGIQPTIQVVYGEQELFNPKFLNRDDVKAAIPGSLLQWYQSDAGQWMRREMSGSVLANKDASTSDHYKITQQVYSDIIGLAQKMTGALHYADAQLLFGSDTPSGPFYAQFPGINGRMEMDRWRESGVGLDKLFKALTIENAKLLKKESELGSVTVGKRANLLLLSENPLVDISAYDSIRLIFLKGKVVKRESLRAI